MMISKASRLALVALLAVGCVQSRPSRNGVPNDNQYVRKDFLVRPADGDAADPGWLMKATFVRTSTPNPLGSDYFSVTPGLDSGAQLVRFKVTEDKLLLVSAREMNARPSDTRTAEVVNAWPAQSVDIKYRVNLDGENTNYLEENVELDWQVRQWVKLHFSKNDLSDVAPMGDFLSDALSRCTDMSNSSTTLVPDSFYTDEKNGYMQWTVSITVPLKWDDETCNAAYGQLGAEALQLGRQNVTFEMMYSFTRAKAPGDLTYQPLEVAEKDPIRHKYGFFESITLARDNDSGLLAGRQLVNRFDPEKPVAWFFAKGFPEAFKKHYAGPRGIAEETNKVLEAAGVKARVSFLNDDDDAVLGDGLRTKDPVKYGRPREYGDVRYSFVLWIADADTESSFIGVTPSINDPRTGETIAASLTLSDFAVKDRFLQRVDAYLQSIGASEGVNGKDPWSDPGPCADGDTLPIVQEVDKRVHNGNSSVYAKMQAYLQKPQSQFGNLGPQDFIAGQDDDFFRAYYQLLPYQVFADPEANPFVVPEGGGGVFGPSAMWDKLKLEVRFQKAAKALDHGETPYDGSGPEALKNATKFLNEMRELTRGHRDFKYAMKFKNKRLGMRMDGPDVMSFEQVASHAARHCIGGKWETREEWQANLLDTFWHQVAFHEFGHALGLTHNFMGSVDKPNFPTWKDAGGRTHIANYTSSVMEYNSTVADVFWHPGWGPYDQGAIAWIYGNTKPSGDKSDSITGQASRSSPWKDALGFSPDGQTELGFLMCNEFHERYTPLCRTFDLGTTPSEIIANQLDAYEWQYQWRNFRSYKKFWNDSEYANTPADLFIDLRRFISMWEFDWSTGELADTLRRIGVRNPDANGSDLEYYSQLTGKFNKELSAANQMIGSFHKAIIQQSSGERPYRTVYDNFYGDVTQQGIILDKLFAMQGWVAMWPTDNYDQNQAGDYFASYSGIGDGSYQYIAEDAVTSMIGGQYDAYPYFTPLAVAQFAQDTHAPEFSGRIDVRDWIGGHVFTRLQDFLDYFRDVAVQYNVDGCTDIGTCTYDPRRLSDNHNEFTGPDQRLWIWAYIPDRNQWVAVQKERNTASYLVVRNFNDDVVAQQDDGSFPGGAYGYELPMKFFLDAFNLYN